jgi:ubiquinone/menaquinone biosynthesis C-methylase UbiE
MVAEGEGAVEGAQPVEDSGGAVRRLEWLVPARVEQEEWLDQGLGSAQAVAQSLADLNRINRWLGGVRSLGLHLYPRLRRYGPGCTSVLDLGSGGCGIPIALARWARAKGVPLHLLALDRQERHLQWASRWVRTWPEISLLQADAMSLPFAASSVDVVISSLFLHHFSEAALAELLPAWARIARRSVIMTDLVRHAIPYYFMQATSPIFARSALTRHDAAVSLRRAYTPAELRRIALAAGLPEARVFTHVPYRMTLVIDREGA